MKKPTKQTTAQSLGSLIKSCRDIMRKDKGLNGDLDRLPMLTWIMFLKFLDDLELQGRRKLNSQAKNSRPRSSRLPLARLGGKPAGVSGDELISFVNQEEAVRRTANAVQDCSLICGHFRAKRRRPPRCNCHGFQGHDNRMISGYLCAT